MQNFDFAWILTGFIDGRIYTYSAVKEVCVKIHANKVSKYKIKIPQIYFSHLEQ